MATLIYALQNFTTTGNTSCIKDNTYLLPDESANIAIQRGQAQPAELQENANFSTLYSDQWDSSGRGFVAVGEDGSLLSPNGNRIALPERTATKSMRNIIGGSAFPKGKTGAEAVARKTLPVYEDVSVGEEIWIVYPNRAANDESINFSGSKIQCGIGLVGDFTTSATINQATFSQTNVGQITPVITYTFGSSELYVIAKIIAPYNIKAGSYLYIWTWMQNSWMITGGDTIWRNTTNAAYLYTGDMMKYQGANNGVLALFTDASSGLTGASNATRNAYTNTDPTGSGGGAFMMGPSRVCKMSDIVSPAQVEDSTGQPEGSLFSIFYDDSYTCGTGGKCIGFKYPLANDSASGDSLINWTTLPARNACRRAMIDAFNTHVFLGLGRNDGITAAEMTIAYNAFWALEEIAAKGKFAATIPPYKAVAGSSADYMTTLATSLTDTSAGRLQLNALIRSDTNLIKYYDIDKLLTAPTGGATLNVIPTARTVVGSMNGSTNVITLTSGNFVGTDHMMRVFVPGAAAAAGILQGRLRVTGPTTALVMHIIGDNRVVNSATATVSQNIYIGGYPYLSNVTDWIHLYRLAYELMAERLGEKGIFCPGSSNFVVPLN